MAVQFFLKVIGTPILTKLGTSTRYPSLDISIVSYLHKYNEELVSFHFVIDLHTEQKQSPTSHWMCVSLPLAPTVQAAVVVLPVCAHGVLFAYEHHFSHTHLH